MTQKPHKECDIFNLRRATMRQICVSVCLCASEIEGEKVVRAHEESTVVIV